MIRDARRRMRTQCLAPDGPSSRAYRLGSTCRGRGSMRTDGTVMQRVNAASAAGSQLELEAVHGKQRPGGIPLTQRRKLAVLIAVVPPTRNFEARKLDHDRTLRLAAPLDPLALASANNETTTKLFDRAGDPPSVVLNLRTGGFSDISEHIALVALPIERRQSLDALDEANVGSRTTKPQFLELLVLVAVVPRAKRRKIGILDQNKTSRTPVTLERDHLLGRCESACLDSLDGTNRATLILVVDLRIEDLRIANQVCGHPMIVCACVRARRSPPLRPIA